MRRERRRRGDRLLDEDDPLAGMVNLFDIAIVFAVGLMVALAAAMQNGRIETRRQDGSMAPIEADIRDGEKLVKYRTTTEQTKGPGRLIGTAYRLPNGEVVYVPDGAEGDAVAPATSAAP